MTVTPDCRDCLPAWDRSNNVKGVILCAKHTEIAESRDLLLKAARAALRARGIWDTDQETGETFGDQLKAAIAKVAP